jgi:ABC-type transport system involved in multi-copper enzyme maturation permease subunit
MSPLVSDVLEPVHQNVSSRRKQFWMELYVGLTVLAGAGATWWYKDQLTLLQQAAVWGVFLLTLAVLSRSGWINLFGPVLFYDAIRTGRRSRYVVLRCLYATALLLVLYWTYTSYINSLTRPFWPRQAYAPNPVLRQSEAAALAASFFYSFMKVQFLALIFFTPAFAAGAIAEEKERKTMEFLLATDLHSREIVLSKLLSRLGSLALLVVTGLPILGILQFMGGVDPNLVLAGFAVTGLSMLSLASVSILTSVYAKKPRTAIVVSYLVLLAYLALASWTSGLPPATSFLIDAFNVGNVFTLLATLQADVAKGLNLADTVPGIVRDYAFFHVPLAVVCSAWAVARLRVLALRQSTAAVSQTSARPGFGIRPRVGRLPMIWKEIFVEPGFRLNWIGWLVFGALFFLSLYVFVGTGSGFFDDLMGGQRYRSYQAGLDRWSQLWQIVWPGKTGANRWALLGQLLNPWVRIAGAGVASLMLVGVAVRASSSISGERDRETLDGLLTSPLQSNDILFGKWLGSLLGVRRAWIWLGLIWGVGIVTGGLHPAALMLAFVAWLVYASCLAGVGLWFSISCRTTLRATLYTLAVTFGVSVGHWMIWLCLLPFCSPFGVGGILELQACITPPAVLYWLLARSDQVGHDMGWEINTILSGFGLFLWAMAACVIWSVSRTRFRKLTSRMPYRRPDFYSHPVHRPALRWSGWDDPGTRPPPV